MTQDIGLVSIESKVVDEVVLSAMELLMGDAACDVSQSHPSQRDDIKVAVYCDANQQSAVVLRCSRPMAQKLAEAMLEMTPDDVQDADIKDATGELVNVIAGNLRGLVSSPGAMTAPFTVEQQVYESFQHAATNTYTFAGEPMQILRV